MVLTVSERGFLIPPSRLRGRGGGTNSAGGSGSGRRVRKARGPGGDARTLHHALAFASQNLNSLMSVDDCMEEFTSLAYICNRRSLENTKGGHRETSDGVNTVEHRPGVYFAVYHD